MMGSGGHLEERQVVIISGSWGKGLFWLHVYYRSVVDG